MFDRAIKILIAAGLFANAAAYLSRSARADDYAITSELERIASNTSDAARTLESIAHGTCSSSKLC